MPAVTLPSPRPGFVTPPGHAYHLNQPKSAMLAHLPQAARELRSFARYEETFGTTVPKAVELVALLEAARDWTALMRATLAWLDYVRPNEGMAWRATLPGLRALKRAFALALRRDASLLTELAGLAAFLGLGKSIARRGVATRKRKAKMAAAASAQVSANGAKAAATPTRRSGLASKTAASAQAPLLKKKSATKLPSRRRKRRA